MSVELREQLAGGGPLLSPRVFWGSNSDRQTVSKSLYPQSHLADSHTLLFKSYILEQCSCMLHPSPSPFMVNRDSLPWLL